MLKTASLLLPLAGLALYLGARPCVDASQHKPLEVLQNPRVRITIVWIIQVLGLLVWIPWIVRVLAALVGLLRIIGLLGIVGLLRIVRTLRLLVGIVGIPRLIIGIFWRIVLRLF